ncbi:hypothetical protein C479_02646 [Halovivax asiaticus JCM 14624]|uniref:Uncharacterized protein n=1 Tax=Halovivax asiaticus JCM 14624 TaxID=1227490 RepID=M0BTI7_9EURY|nr:hypothetical protein [Halovivax asiaticus]ELZ13708.1 hypothetical protein C479_02646 [Halovivax asiaticus JCM 14624]
MVHNSAESTREELTRRAAGVVTRRRALGAGTSAVSLALAGCLSDDASDEDDTSDGQNGSGTGGGSGDGSGDGSGSDGGGGTDGGSESGGGSGTGGGGTGDITIPDGLGDVDIEGELVGNSVDGLEVVDHQPYEADGHSTVVDGAFSLIVTVENTGEQEIDLLGYTYSLSLYDASGSVISEGASTRSLEYGVSAGEIGAVETWSGNGAMAENVARYELSLTCDGMFADGVYCE